MHEHTKKRLGVRNVGHLKQENMVQGELIAGHANTLGDRSRSITRRILED
jgi:hypothetical protein